MDVTLEDARNRLDDLLDLAASGVDVVVTRKGKSPVHLVAGSGAQQVRRGLHGQELRAAIDKIVSSIDLSSIPLDQRTSNHDDLYDEAGAPK